MINYFLLFSLNVLLHRCCFYSPNHLVFPATRSLAMQPSTKLLHLLDYHLYLLLLLRYMRTVKST